ncbi:ribosomal RNA small subunit methyltransferase B [Clostridium acetireducens DSM 10703]|jgi:16S rRNA (cytosine967-C5)-methyltransferase|uniref:16S rRNA (cytosine(967)-C(5))-methyltransferase n=1 Tax=Clostridium acetireducens DSM 10703 TaxID=1121290 RepID=A0A1E8F2A2_9CLOT|nr:16S rRNA (cytosine(967)-C(5))-methyltransferase RsmB [Clostridium acetireducens]OFI07671.1 ribosomal RNA small subunit methyltransferase B [Clostridium acetireducens DSM 10703]
MDSARKIAIDVLQQVIYDGAYSNIELNNKLKNCKLNDKDKGLVTEIVYGTLKYKYSIDKIISYYIKKTDSIDGYILNILRTAIYQIRYLNKIPDFAAVNESVELTKIKNPKLSKLVNAVLRNYLRNKKITYCNSKDIVEKLSFKYSFHPWMVKMFNKQYGKEITEKILNESNKTPAVTVRVNDLKTNYEEAWHSLSKFGYTIEEGSVCPEAIKIIKGKNIESNPLFKEGMITVQDESAMLVAPSLDLEENFNVLDLCSAPGGKSTHISEIMNNTGRVYAYDVHKSKMRFIKENSERLGIDNIVCSVMDASILNKELINRADRILIDVPCSGLGIIRKKPEIKWNKNSQNTNKLIDIQRKIMTNAAKYTKLGGILVYSTCTLNKNENEKNIKWFLDNFPQFKLVPVYYGKLDNIIYDEKGFATIIPGNNMDGFFIAKFIRNW